MFCYNCLFIEEVPWVIGQKNESDSDSEEQYTSRVFALYSCFLVLKLVDIPSNLWDLLLTKNMQAADQGEIK